MLNFMIKLLDFFMGKYDNDRFGCSGLVFEIERMERWSKVIW